MNKKVDEAIGFEEIPYPIRREEFFGNRRAIEIIEKSLITSTLNQSIIISGPPSIGKTSLAFVVASSLECENPSPFACGNCLSCRKIKKGIFPDLKYITLLEDEKGKFKTQISVEQIREDVLKVAELPPFEGKKTIFIIEPAEALNPSSQNALLKILEEPPSYVQFFIIAKEVSKLLPTIRSRCVEIKLKEISFDEMVEIGKTLNFKSDLKKVVLSARGRVGLIISGKYEEYYKLREKLEKLVTLQRDIGEYKNFASLIEEVSEFDTYLVLDETLYLLREFLRKNKEGKVNLEEESLFKKYERAIKSVEMINRNVNPKLIFSYIFLGE